mgnify:CR=1 FL=1
MIGLNPAIAIAQLIECIRQKNFLNCNIKEDYPLEKASSILKTPLTKEFIIEFE